ncbi:MAG: hypothetical protein DSY66_02770 [Persephonella sp.]|nr:MAG: hypothetical protein DSY53_02390 [Persephonella sp.]RUM61147.1 MAG: hypothetical protein DSY66_02770 [Persephonella sp.]
MSIFRKLLIILLAIYGISLGDVKIAPKFTLKDVNNEIIELNNFKDYKLILLAFINPNDKIALNHLKDIAREFQRNKDLKVILILTKLDMSPIELNNFVAINNLDRLNIIVLKGDGWIMKAYSIKRDRNSYFFIAKVGKDFIILKRFDEPIDILKVKTFIRKTLR